ncbi:VPA1262 family N-terminal domain-containing protein [Leptospira bouyouniensis]|uniref:Uncharacterized protein n=1 Tax=Leptospira bouyouniensis TaxID=2484911 RepID=A0ABY2L0Q1_9LEPT|nr:VPA1262 family N-terminal domain-containing protein [Leptospira bouyouniensis]TGK45941.1 hypothetical protein EHQ10_18745 [Leptospira bouyouniensis]
MDYEILTTNGNIAFFKSCEVTELFLFRKTDKAILNFFTIAVFEEKPFFSTNETYLTRKPINLNADYSLGIKRYWLSMNEVYDRYQKLRTEYKWISSNTSTSQFPPLKNLPKQFIPSFEGNRINNILKNNFHCGSYILEFFDELKNNFDFLLKIEAINKLNQLCENIKQFVPIDLSVVRDRIGNFIFQFPVTILEIKSKALKNWDGVELNFAWHTSIQIPPDCLLQVESTIEKNYSGSVIVDYDKTQKQQIKIGNLDQINRWKIWRKEPSLILSSFQGTYIRAFNLNMGIISPESRLFEHDGKMVEVPITSHDLGNRNLEKVDYTNYISNNLYDAEKKKLEKSLSFKQYRKSLNGGLKDLQHLINLKDENGVYLWDPFLSSNDILQTLYYSGKSGVPLKAIGSINDKIKKVYNSKGRTLNDVIEEYRVILANPKNNNYHLNFEFRIQHSNFGWAFHDRFLIFPGNKFKRSQVYSLGTSVNSFGYSHHILQEVSHPQPVVDAFTELWEQLNFPECLVWKFPK